MYLTIGNHINITNDGYVNVSHIGSFTNGPYLSCRTDNTRCCSIDYGERQGNWFYPNGTQVDSYKSGTNSGPKFFGRNRGSSSVNLFRGGSPSERGRFRCEVPDAAGVNRSVYANICKLPEVNHELHNRREQKFKNHVLSLCILL